MDRATPTSEVDDTALAAAGRTDAEAFATLYRRHRDAVYRYVRSRTGSDEDALDLTQQTFTKAWAAIPSFRPARAPFTAWLFAIARNTVTDFHRRDRPTQSESVWSLASADDVEEEVSTLIDIDHLRLALQDLPPEKRDLLALRFAAGLTVPEIARIMGTTSDATYKQLSRTLQQLRGAIDDSE